MSLVIKIPRLRLNRFGVFCIRVYYTDHAGKTRETTFSLSTKHPQIARILALQFNQRYELLRAMKKPVLSDFQHLLKTEPSKFEIDLQRGILKTDGTLEDYERMNEALTTLKELQGTEPMQPQQVSKIVQKSKKFSEVVALYLEEKKFDNKPYTIKAKERTYTQFQSIFGDIEINLISKQELVSWKSGQLKQDIRATTINSKIGEINDLFTYAINNGYYTASDKTPTDGLKIGKSKNLKTAHESYEPFTNDELNLIFSDKYHQTYNNLNKPDYYFIPIMALYTGARREEIAGLKVEHIRDIDGICSIEIEEGKTANARRVIPIHPKLEKLGLLDYVEYIESIGEIYLFPHLKVNDNGRGKNTGRRFSDYLRDDLEITSSRKVFHSFRHTAITRFHTLNANPAHVLQIVGHSDEAKGVHFHTYTHDVGLKALKDTVDKLNYPIDTNTLKVEDPCFKGFIGKWQKQVAREKLRTERNERLLKKKLRTEF